MYVCMCVCIGICMCGLLHHSCSSAYQNFVEFCPITLCLGKLCMCACAYVLVYVCVGSFIIAVVQLIRILFNYFVLGEVGYVCMRMYWVLEYVCVGSFIIGVVQLVQQLCV